MDIFILHIIKSYQATIKFFDEGKEIFTVSTSECLGDEINLEIQNPKNFVVYVYPHKTKNFLPFSFNLDLINLKSSSSLAQVFSLPENNIVLNLLPLSMQENSISANKIELIDGKLKKLTFLNDICGRAKVEIFSSNEGSLIKEEEYFVYTGKEKKELSNEIILLDFFQSVYANDFTAAQRLLADPLYSKLTKETIKEFFGDFSSCKLVNYYSVPSVVLFYEKDAKVFSCNITNQKISDIYEINWQLLFVNINWKQWKAIRCIKNVQDARKDVFSTKNLATNVA